VLNHNSPLLVRIENCKSLHILRHFCCFVYTVHGGQWIHPFDKGENNLSDGYRLVMPTCRT